MWYVPVMNKDVELVSSREVRHGDKVTAVYAHGAKTTSRLLHTDGREVEVSADLVLGLPVVRPVLTR